MTVQSPTLATSSLSSNTSETPEIDAQLSGDDELDFTHLFLNKEYLESDSLDGVFMTPEEMAALSAEGGAGGFVDMPRDIYCPVLDDMPRACWARSVLELWKNDVYLVANLTPADIMDKLKGDNASEVQFGHKGVIKR